LCFKAVSILFLRRQGMSGLITGLTIGGACAGAVAGFGLYCIDNFANIFNPLAKPNELALPKTLVIGALAGGALFAGGGWIAEGGLTQAFKNGAGGTAPASIELPSTCFNQAPKGAKVEITREADGTPKCIVTMP
jgi:hypothetical protein